MITFKTILPYRNNNLKKEWNNCFNLREDIESLFLVEKLFYIQHLDINDWFWITLILKSLSISFSPFSAFFWPCCFVSISSLSFLRPHAYYIPTLESYYAELSAESVFYIRANESVPSSNGIALKASIYRFARFRTLFSITNFLLISKKRGFWSFGESF